MIVSKIIDRQALRLRVKKKDGVEETASFFVRFLKGVRGVATKVKDLQISLDTDDVQQLIKKLRTVYTEEQAKKMVKRALTRTGKKVKAIVKTEVPKSYHITKAVVGKDIKAPIVRTDALQNPTCTIPIVGTKHIIGGKTFTARGGKPGWTGVRGGKRYKIRAQIVKGKTSVLPTEMSRQGGNPPFRNTSASKLNKAVFTRPKGVGFPPKNLPIARVVGVAVPQMPMNRSEADIQEEIVEHLKKRLIAEHELAIKGIGR